MASVITEAIMQGVVSSMDPMNGMTQQFMRQQIENQRVQANAQKLDCIAQVSNAIEELGSSPDAAVLAAYRKILGDLTK